MVATIQKRVQRMSRKKRMLSSRGHLSDHAGANREVGGWGVMEGEYGVGSEI